MDSLKRRNSPETPKTSKFDAEIRRSPYIGGGKRRAEEPFLEGLQISRIAKPKTGLFFHSIGPDGQIQNQGHLLALTSDGYGRAQLFEWFFGEPSTIIRVTPDYLAACIFYTSAAAMNAAYAASEVRDD